MQTFRTALVFCAGALTGALLTFFLVRARPEKVAERVEPSVCYSCFWQGYDVKLHADLIDYYKQYKNPDPLVLADTRYILWRATGIPNCDIRREYRKAAKNDPDPQRRYIAYSTLAFGALECGEESSSDYAKAADAAREIGLSSEAKILRELSGHRFTPKIDPSTVNTSLSVPADARSFVLGRSKIEVTKDTLIGSQVDRVTRDWISYQLKWDLKNGGTPALPISYHEGALLNQIRAAVNALIIPLPGSIAVRLADKWYAADEDGVFRFEVLPDKIIYPTTHVDRDTAWIEDTHGVSALVPAAVEHNVTLVVGCGDSDGKMAAALHLAKRGVNVFFPGDRYQDELLGYSAKGTLIGGAPVRTEQGRAIIGDQPVEFSLSEPIIVEDSIAPFPLQYYDAPARYFRRFSQTAPLRVTYVQVDNTNQLYKVLQAARDKKSSAIAVRIFTDVEYAQLADWLRASPRNRAILFHSALYPHAQKLFSEFRQQLTFGDLHPEFLQ
jgi:hypothetical protein